MKFVAPALPTLYTVALPCGAIVLPFHRMSPPELATAPVSKFKAEPVCRIVFSLRSARTAPGNTLARIAIAIARAGRVWFIRDLAGVLSTGSVE